MQKFLYFFTAAVCIGHIAAAQSFNVSGIAKDNNGAAVAGVTMSLLNAADSAWVQSELTGDKGEFGTHT